MSMCYINTQKQLCFENGTPMHQPTILFENDTDVLHKIGEADVVKAYHDIIMTQYASLGIGMPDLVTIELTKIPVEDVCYIIRRASEYTLSGFLPKLYQLVTTKPEEEVIAWLTDEKTRISIDVYANL